MDDLATLAIRIESRDSEIAAQRLDKLAASGERAEKVVVSASDKMTQKITQQHREVQKLGAEWERLTNSDLVRAAKAYDKMFPQGDAAKRGRESAKSMMDAMEQQFKLDMARIKDGQARGFINPAEARTAGRDAALAYNQGLTGAIDKGYRTGAFNGKDGSAAYVTLANSLKNVAETSQRAGVGMGRLRESVTSMAAMALSSAPGVLQFSSVLGSLALGTTVTVGVMAGLAAVGFVWDKLTEKTRLSRKETDEAIQSLEKLARLKALGPGGETVAQVEAARNDVAANRMRISQLQAERYSPNTLGGLTPGAGGRNEGRVAQNQREIDRLLKLITLGEQAINDAEQKAAIARNNTYVGDLANLVQYNRANASERANALALFKDYQRQLGFLAKNHPEQTALRTALAANVEQLKGALFPNATKDANKLNAAQEALARMGDEVARFHQEATSFGKDGAIDTRVQGMLNQLDALERKYPMATAALEEYKASVKASGELMKQAAYDKVAADILTQYDAQKALTAAQLDGNGALQAATQAQRANAEIRKQELALGRSLAEQERQRIRDTVVLQDVVTDAQGTANLKAQADAIRLENEALRSGAADRETYVINKQAELQIAQALLIADAQQRANRLAEIEDLRQANLEHVKIQKSIDANTKAQDAAAAAAKKAADEARDRWKTMLDDMQRGISGFFQNIFEKGVLSFRSLFDQIKQLFFKLLADMVAAKLVQKVAGSIAGVLGIFGAGVVRGQGAGLAPGFDMSRVADATYTGPGNKANAFASGLSGLGVGYGIGSSTTHMGQGAVTGALGGAASGALIGTMFAPGIGTAIGAVAGAFTGLVGGIIGSGNAARKAAKEMKDLQASLALNLAAYRAQLNGDQRGVAIAQAQAHRDEDLKAINAAYSGKKWETIRNQMREQRIADEKKEEDKINAQFANDAKAQKEDYEVRRLRATGQTKAADDMAFALQQKREYDALVASGADEQTKAALRQAQAAEKAAQATNSLTESLSNVPAGYKIALDRFNATAGITPGVDRVGPTIPTPIPVRNVPGVASSTAPQTQLAPVYQISGPISITSSATNAKDLMNDLAKELEAVSRGGGSSRLTVAIQQVVQ